MFPIITMQIYIKNVKKPNFELIIIWKFTQFFINLQ